LQRVIDPLNNQNPIKTGFFNQVFIIDYIGFNFSVEQCESIWNIQLQTKL